MFMETYEHTRNKWIGIDFFHPIERSWFSSVDNIISMLTGHNENFALFTNAIHVFSINRNYVKLYSN